jgi:hypothetical protein
LVIKLLTESQIIFNTGKKEIKNEYNISHFGERYHEYEGSQNNLI